MNGKGMLASRKSTTKTPAQKALTITTSAVSRNAEREVLGRCDSARMRNKIPGVSMNTYNRTAMGVVGIECFYQ
jgi:hypothetical protein